LGLLWAGFLFAEVAHMFGQFFPRVWHYFTAKKVWAAFAIFSHMFGQHF
jgi:hypothetical protein